MVVSFIGITIFSRELGAHTMGVFFLFQAVLGMLSIPSDFGVSRAVMKRLSEGSPTGETFTTGVVLKTVLLALFACVIFLLRGSINEYIGAKLAAYLVVALVLQGFGELMLRVLEGELRVGATALPSLSRQLVFVGVGLVLVRSGMDVIALVYALLAGLIVLLAWTLYRSTVSISYPSRRSARSLFEFSRYSFISSIGGYVFSWVDVAIIGLFLTQSSVGVYEIAWRVTAVAMLFSTSISTAIYPQVSKWDADDATNRIENLLPKAIAVPLFFVIPGLFGAMLFSQDILHIVFGDEFASGWLVLIVLMAARVLQSIHTILARSLQGIDRPDLGAKAVTIAISANIILNAVLIIHYGIVGAAAATATSFLINTVLHGYYLSRFLTIRLPLPQIGGTIVAASSMAVVLWVVQSHMSIDSLITLFSVVLLGAVLHGVFGLILRPTREMIIDTIGGLT